MATASSMPTFPRGNGATTLRLTATPATDPAAAAGARESKRLRCSSAAPHRSDVPAQNAPAGQSSLPENRRPAGPHRRRRVATRSVPGAQISGAPRSRLRTAGALPAPVRPAKGSGSDDRSGTPPTTARRPHNVRPHDSLRRKTALPHGRPESATLCPERMPWRTKVGVSPQPISIAYFVDEVDDEDALQLRDSRTMDFSEREIQGRAPTVSGQQTHRPAIRGPHRVCVAPRSEHPGPLPRLPGWPATAREASD